VWNTGVTPRGCAKLGRGVSNPPNGVAPPLPDPPPPNEAPKGLLDACGDATAALGGAPLNPNGEALKAPPAAVAVPLPAPPPMGGVTDEVGAPAAKGDGAPAPNGVGWLPCGDGAPGAKGWVPAVAADEPHAGVALLVSEAPPPPPMPPDAGAPLCPNEKGDDTGREEAGAVAVEGWFTAPNAGAEVALLIPLVDGADAGAAPKENGFEAEEAGCASTGAALPPNAVATAGAAAVTPPATAKGLEGGGAVPAAGSGEEKELTDDCASPPPLPGALSVGAAGIFPKEKGEAATGPLPTPSATPSLPPPRVAEAGSASACIAGTGVAKVVNDCMDPNAVFDDDGGISVFSSAADIGFAAVPKLKGDGAPVSLLTSPKLLTRPLTLSPRGNLASPSDDGCGGGVDEAFTEAKAPKPPSSPPGAAVAPLRAFVSPKGELCPNVVGFLTVDPVAAAAANPLDGIASDGNDDSCRNGATAGRSSMRFSRSSIDSRLPQSE